MAEEENVPVEEAAEEVEEVKKGSLKKLIILGAALAVLGGGGFAGWKFFLAKKMSSSKDQAEQVTQKESVTPGIMCKMDPFIVNLLDQDGKRYLKTQFQIEVDSEEVQKELQERIAQVRDAILLLLTSKTFSQIGVPGGKIELRTELVERINAVLSRGSIRTLYFTEFVVQ
jgi:flagellar FliL protein